MGCINSSKTVDEPEMSADINISKTPAEKPLVEYRVSVPYSSEMDSWMQEYALEHRTSNQEELHLFTFSDGKQFEYWMAVSGASEKGFLYPSSWTEEPDESLSPNKISEEQCRENLEALLSKWNGAYFEMQADSNYGERLYVYTGQPLAGSSYSDAASYLKNYIDYKPDREAYGLVIQAPMADGQNTIVKAFAYEPKNHVLFEAEMTNLGSTSNTVWTDTTYTTIVNAIETNTFTNHPGKMGLL